MTKIIAKSDSPSGRRGAPPVGSCTGGRRRRPPCTAAEPTHLESGGGGLTRGAPSGVTKTTQHHYHERRRHIICVARAKESLLMAAPHPGREREQRRAARQRASCWRWATGPREGAPRGPAFVQRGPKRAKDKTKVPPHPSYVYVCVLLPSPYSPIPAPPKQTLYSESVVPHPSLLFLSTAGSQSKRTAGHERARLAEVTPNFPLASALARCSPPPTSWASTSALGWLIKRRTPLTPPPLRLSARAHALHQGPFCVIHK